MVGSKIPPNLIAARVGGREGQGARQKGSKSSDRLSPVRKGKVVGPKCKKGTQSQYLTRVNGALAFRASFLPMTV